MTKGQRRSVARQHRARRDAAGDAMSAQGASPALKAALAAERKQWLAEHPGRKFPGYTAEVMAWRRASYRKADRAMRRAWLKDHPGDPLPEHLCALDHPFRGQARWCAAAKRWLDAYDRRSALP